MDQIYLFAILALIAEILGTIGGFGSSLFFVPIASHFLDFHSVLGVTALFHVCSNLSKIAMFRQGFDKKLIVSVGIPAVVFVIAGAYLSKFVDSKKLEIFLAYFLMAISLLFYKFKNFKINPSKTNAFFGGMFSGFSAGLLGTGGAIRGLTLTAFDLKIETFIATSAVIDLAIDSSRAVVYASNGFVHTHDMYLIPILLIVSVIGTYIGKRVLAHISQEKFKIIVLALIFLIGLSCFIN